MPALAWLRWRETRARRAPPPLPRVAVPIERVEDTRGVLRQGSVLLGFACAAPRYAALAGEMLVGYRFVLDDTVLQLELQLWHMRGVAQPLELLAEHAFGIFAGGMDPAQIRLVVAEESDGAFFDVHASGLDDTGRMWTSLASVRCTRKFRLVSKQHWTSDQALAPTNMLALSLAPGWIVVDTADQLMFLVHRVTDPESRKPTSGLCSGRLAQSHSSYWRVRAECVINNRKGDIAFDRADFESLSFTWDTVCTRWPGQQLTYRDFTTLMLTELPGAAGVIVGVKMELSDWAAVVVFMIGCVDGHVDVLYCEREGDKADDVCAAVQQLFATYSEPTHRVWSNANVLQRQSLARMDHPKLPLSVLGYSKRSLPPPSAPEQSVELSAAHVTAESLPRPRRQRRTY